MNHKLLIQYFKKFKAIKIKLKIIAFLMLVLGLTGLQAQELTTATGGNASGSGGSLSFSVGQVVYQTLSGTNGSLVQGVQQPYEISVVTGIEEAKGISLMISAYPNPATDYLTLKVENFLLSPEGFRDLNFHLFDMNGKLIQNEIITRIETSIVTSNLVPATYFLKVIQGKEEVKTFKIVKH